MHLSRTWHYSRCAFREKASDRRGDRASSRPYKREADQIYTTEAGPRTIFTRHIIGPALGLLYIAAADLRFSGESEYVYAFRELSSANYNAGREERAIGPRD